MITTTLDKAKELFDGIHRVTSSWRIHEFAEDVRVLIDDAELQAHIMLIGADDLAVVVAVRVVDIDGDDGGPYPVYAVTQAGKLEEDGTLQGRWPQGYETVNPLFMERAVRAAAGEIKKGS